ncbi:Acetyl-CoA:oxalate CoA-transferase [Tolypocladium ophioglossoides CBS 100239]|uniref:Acetyl-CoA:oxalate CoA-transferase n=1 Tax=Tolypocladium ophioglossoides (strain CBS 100239) TaxID=1163406 RepID=A0A0L0N0E2_TOLOC|nr:Acetyl-CoA:oxalate CoA-transferase [Tolypocladium ophioglossoides CBS 100239]
MSRVIPPPSPAARSRPTAQTFSGSRPPTSLAALPALDRDLARGKRTVQLDVRRPDDKQRLLELLRTCDVFLQGFRPRSLAAYGLSPQDLARANPAIVCASLSAFGPRGPWAHRRGFDSLVQTCSGMSVSEAAHAGSAQPARATPCQALDHASGHLLAAGIAAALYRAYPGDTGFACADRHAPDDVPADMLETRETAFGPMTAVRHSAEVEGMEAGWEEMPKPLGTDEPRWL